MTAVKAGGWRRRKGDDGGQGWRLGPGAEMTAVKAGGWRRRKGDDGDPDW